MKGPGESQYLSNTIQPFYCHENGIFWNLVILRDFDQIAMPPWSTLFLGDLVNTPQGLCFGEGSKSLLTTTQT